MTEIKNGMPPIHPGEILADELEELGKSSDDFASALAVSPHTIREVLACEESVTADLALRLGRYFSSGPHMWLNLQKTYDLRVAEIASGDDIARQVTPLKEP